MALSAVLWAQSAAGSGVGAAAAALSLGAAALGAVLVVVAWDAEGAGPFEAGACEGLPVLHAAKRTIDANARAGTLRWVLIPLLLHIEPPQARTLTIAVHGPGRVARYHTRNRVHTYDFMMVVRAR
jgi:hypothetical protein